MARRITGVLLAVLFLATMSACGNSDDPSEDVVDISGDWDFTVDVTVANGGCEGEEIDGPDDPSTDFITVTVEPAAGQPGKVLVRMSGFLGEPDNVASVVRDSVRVNSIVTVAGEWPEDGGTTVSAFTLEVKSANLMEGSEAWEFFFDGVKTCPNSASNVTAVRD
jgi:major membrane immunogen (membrane-anchored lipoprotein)